MAKHEHFFLDQEGLRNLLIRIRDYFASKQSLETEIDERQASDNSLQSDINDLSQLLSEETTTRENQFLNLDERLIQEISDRDAIIKSEYNERINAESVLSGAISAEATERQSKIDEVIGLIKSLYDKNPETEEETGTLITKINIVLDSLHQETLDRDAAIGQEVTNRNNAISSAIQDEVTNRNNAIAAEAQLRTNKDDALQSGINDANADITALTTRVGNLEDGTALDTEMSDTSEFGVQNKVIKKYIDDNTFRYTFKGSVTNYEDLPTEGLSKGDMYNVINPCEPDEDHHYQGNTNFVWDGDSWFALSSSIDLSAYYTKDQTYSQTEVDNLISGLTDTVYTKSEVDFKLDALDQDLDTINDRLESLEDKAIEDIQMDGQSIIDNTGIVSLESTIQISNELPETGDIDKLYRVEDKVYKWVEGDNPHFVELGSDTSGGGSGTDEELTERFNAHISENNLNPHPQLTTLISGKASASDLADLSTDYSNYKESNNTALTYKVDKLEFNTYKTEVQGSLDGKVSTDTYQTGMASKLNTSDIVDDLEHPDSEKVLSANQGVELDQRIEAIKTTVTGLGAGLVFKGTVASYEELPANADNGDCYQIYAENTQDPHHGETYAYIEGDPTGEWIKIVSSAQDLSALIASQTDINRIIIEYRQ